MHITVRFLGHCRESILVALSDRLAALPAIRQPFELGARGLRVMPGLAEPRVLCVGIEDLSGGLARLATEVEQMCRYLGFAPEERPFKPHLTLGRVKHAPAAGEESPLAAIVSEGQGLDLGSSRIRELIVYESLAPPGTSSGGKAGRHPEYLPRIQVPIGEPARRAERPAKQASSPTGEHDHGE
jgi:2'-5' RNA ligase